MRMVVRRRRRIAVRGGVRRDAEGRCGRRTGHVRRSHREANAAAGAGDGATEAAGNARRRAAHQHAGPQPYRSRPRGRQVERRSLDRLEAAGAAVE